MSKSSAVLLEDTEKKYIRKANELITSKYQLSLFGNKVVSISLTKMRVEDNQVVSVLTPADIKMVLGNPKDTNIYRKIKNVSENLAGNIVTIEDRKNRRFKTFAMITNVEYHDQRLKITYNKEMTPYINELTAGGYTSLELGTLVSFDKNSTYRLYEILKKNSYRIAVDGLAQVVKTYSFNELKAMIGLINVDAPYLRKLISEGKDWDEIVEKYCHDEDKQYNNWGDFQKRVLRVAQYEMENKADIRFDYTPIRSGKGGKVTAIQFLIYPNTPSTSGKQQVAMSISRLEKSKKEDECKAAYNQLLLYLQEVGIDNTTPFTEKYFKKLWKVAKNDLEAIKKEIDYSKTVPHIHNYYAWLMKAVEDRYSDSEIVDVRSEGSNWEDDDFLEPTNDMKKSLWERYKGKEEFDEFLNRYGVTVEELEEAYTWDELVKMYIDHRRTLAGIQ